MTNSPVNLPDFEKLHGEHLGLPAWAWPTLGFAGGLLLVLVIHGTCFVEKEC